VRRVWARSASWRDGAETLARRGYSHGIGDPVTCCGGVHRSVHGSHARGPVGSPELWEGLVDQIVSVWNRLAHWLGMVEELRETA